MVLDGKLIAVAWKDLSQTQVSENLIVQLSNILEKRIIYQPVRDELFQAPSSSGTKAHIIFLLLQLFLLFLFYLFLGDGLGDIFYPSVRPQNVPNTAVGGTSQRMCPHET